VVGFAPKVRFAIDSPVEERGFELRLPFRKIEFAIDSLLEGWRGVDANFRFRNSHHAPQDRRFRTEQGVEGIPVYRTFVKAAGR
jgi:hypothetical protein